MENMANTKQKVSLYEKLGAEEGLKRIVNDILDKNFNNPIIGHYFRDIDMPRLKQLVFEFFSMGTGGPHQYTGRDMRTSHSRMNISEEDFQSGNEDVSLVLKEHGIHQEEINEVIAILDSMKADIVSE
ncbi:MAG: group I truncated hemoglobin [Flavitalea sp.]